MFIGAAMLMGMMTINTVSAQTPEQLKKLREQRGEAMINNVSEMGGCVDNDEWMTAEGYGQSGKSPQIARTKARNEANKELIEKMESYVERIAKGLSYSETNEATDDVYASTLTDKFNQVTQGMRGRIRECFVVPETTDRGMHTCKYVAVISLKDLNNALKDAIAKDKTLSAQTKMEDFDKQSDEALEGLLNRRDNYINKD